jgi:hypothetical protein
MALVMGELEAGENGERSHFNTVTHKSLIDASYSESQTTTVSDAEREASENNGDLQPRLRHHLQNSIRIPNIQPIQAPPQTLLPDQRTAPPTRITRDTIHHSGENPKRVVVHGV